MTHIFKVTIYFQLNQELQHLKLSICFIYKAIFHGAIPTFDKVKGQFVKNKDKCKAEESILQSHLITHGHNSKDLYSKYTVVSDNLKNKVGVLFFNCFLIVTRSNINQLKCKNKELHRLISQKTIKRGSYNIPAINLPSHELDVSGLKYGLHQIFTDRNKYIKRNLAVQFDALS